MCEWIKEELNVSQAVGCHFLQHVKSQLECAKGDTRMTTPSNTQYICNVGITT